METRSVTFPSPSRAKVECSGMIALKLGHDIRRHIGASVCRGRPPRISSCAKRMESMTRSVPRPKSSGKKRLCHVDTVILGLDAEWGSVVRVQFLTTVHQYVQNLTSGWAVDTFDPALMERPVRLTVKVVVSQASRRQKAGSTSLRPFNSYGD